MCTESTLVIFNITADSSEPPKFIVQKTTDLPKTGQLKAVPVDGTFSLFPNSTDWVQWLDNNIPPKTVLGTITGNTDLITIDWTNPLTKGESRQSYGFKVNYMPRDSTMPVVPDPTVENDPPGSPFPPS